MPWMFLFIFKTVNSDSQLATLTAERKVRKIDNYAFFGQNCKTMINIITPGIINKLNLFYFIIIILFHSCIIFYY